MLSGSVQDRECYCYICFSYRTERMRWIEAFTPQNQGDSDDKIYESWGKWFSLYALGMMVGIGNMPLVSVIL